MSDSRDPKDVFQSCKIENWEFEQNIANESGQAAVAFVQRTSDGKQGVFRYLKKPEAVSIERFRREVTILTDPKFHSPNVVRILAHSVDEPYWYISERGEDFGRYWNSIRADDTNTQVTKAVGIISQLVEGLIPLHAQGCVHRDIKPGNIVVVGGVPVLIDFGLVYSQYEERISPENRPAGNRFFSPDMMLHHNEEVLPWFDVYMLSQLLIWMISEKSPKGWFRPLDWRFVKYPEDLSPENLAALKALTASCSDPVNGIKNAGDLKKLICNLFPNKEVVMPAASRDLSHILESVRKGRAESIVLKTDNASKFAAQFPLFDRFLTELGGKLVQLIDRYAETLPVKLSPILDRDKWIERLTKSGGFDKEATVIFCTIRCQEEGSKSFGSNLQISYVGPKQASATEAGAANTLTDEYLPFALRLNTNSSNIKFHETKKTVMFNVAVDRAGQLYKFDWSFKNPVPIAVDDLIAQVEGWITDQESWKLLY